MNIQNKILLGIASFVGIMLLVGWVAINEPARMAVFTEQWHGRSIERGAELYLNNCTTCHGLDGKGLAGVAPALNNPMFFLPDNPAKVVADELKALTDQQKVLQDSLTAYSENVAQRADLQSQFDAAAEGSEERTNLQSQIEALDAQIRLVDPTQAQGQLDDLTTQIAEKQAELDALVAEGWDPNRDIRLREVSWNGSHEDYLRSTLIGGRPTSKFYWPAPMPAWAQSAGGPLRDDEIENLVTYIMNYRDEAESLAPLDVNQQYKRPVDEALAGSAGPREVIGTDVDVTTLELTGGDAEKGSQLYAALGCAGCHTAPSGAAYSFAPTAGTFTRVQDIRLRQPEVSEKYTTAEQYLAASIVHPNEYIAPGGSPGVMPQNFGEALTIEELRDIIAYLETYQ